MNRKQIIALVGGICCVAVLSVVTVLFFQYRNAPDLAENEAVEEAAADVSGFEIEQKDAEEEEAVPEIEPITPEPKDIIEEPADVDPTDSLPEPAVTETKDTAGNITQTPNWGTKEDSASTPAPSSGTPKNGSTKTIDGAAYTYVEGFGWVKDGTGNVGITVEVELSGEKVGY